MKELEFNLENLFKLGLTPEILKNNFVEWMVENNDIIVDLKNNIIYYDVLNYKQELDDLLEVTKKGLLKSGKTSEEVEHLIQQQRVDVNAQFDIALEDLPDREKNEFLTHIIPKLRDDFYELKKGFYDDKLKDILRIKSYKNEIHPIAKVKIEETQELSKSVNKYISVKQGKTEIACLNDLFSKNKDILPESIKNAYKSIGVIKTLFIYQVEDNTIKNVCLDDLDPFENVPRTTIIEYHCIESNYLNLMSKIEDGTFVFFDNLSIDLYLYEYAKAFKLAYSEFETILNQNQSLITDTQEQKALKIFSYILNAEYKNGYFGGDYENIEELQNKKGMYVTNDEMYEWGYKGGQFFKAWEIILNNPIIFEPLFEKFIFPKSIEKIDVKHEASTNNLLKSTIDDYREEFKPLSLANIPKSKKIGDKWHALLYLIEIEVYQKKIPTNVEGAFIKSEIEQIGKDRCKNSGQGFYRQVRDLKGNIKDDKSVKRLFNDGWKTVIIELSNNDENIIKYLNTF